MSTQYTCHTNHWHSTDRRRSVSAILALAICGLTPTAGYAYTAAGDRNFPANLILPQVAPSDAIWIPFSTQPFDAAKMADPTRETSFTGTYSKTITERLGIQFSDGLAREDRLDTTSLNGAQNFDVLLQYEAILDPSHEAVLSVQVEHNFGQTGDKNLNSYQQSFTQPAVTFAKGFGDLPIGYWRPLAITGYAGYQIGEGGPNKVNAGFSVQYSMPYLGSKVANVDLPPFLRGMTPMVEVLYSAPAGPSRGGSQTLEVAPGVSYSRGRGWELAIEATIPTNKATGSGLGVIAQVVIQLDYLLPETVFGRPIFPPH